MATNTVRENDILLRLGAVLDELASGVNDSVTTFTVLDGTLFTAGERYVVGSECVRVSSIATNDLTVVRGLDSIAASHSAGDSLTAVTSVHSAVLADEIAQALSPPRTPDSFLVLPQKAAKTAREVAGAPDAAWSALGVFQDGGGTREQVATEAGIIHARLGLVILRNPAGGHWDIDVRGVA